MKEVKYNDYLKKATESLPKGAFLTVKNDDQVNTMTIGWATAGIAWAKPVLMVMVRESRYTYQLIENTDEFTVSFVFDDSKKKELNFCGTKSGRNFDKFSECNLKKIPGQEVSTPVIEGCDLHYECKIVYKQPMDSNTLDTIIDNNAYSNNDYHTLYYGQIVKCYLEE